MEMNFTEIDTCDKFQEWIFLAYVVGVGRLTTYGVLFKDLISGDPAKKRSVKKKRESDNLCKPHTHTHTHIHKHLYQTTDLYNILHR
jgi:hypothetical protein